MSWNNRGGSMAHNPPFVVPVQIMPEMNDFIPLFTGYTLDCIVSTAGQNAARAMFKELMEQDQKALGEMVQTLANLTEFYVVSEGLNPNQVETAIRNTVQIVVNAYLAMAVNAYPQEFGQVIDQAQARDVQNYIRQLEDIQFEAQRFFGGGGGGQQGGWTGGGNVRGAAPQQRGWQPPQGGGRAAAGGGWAGRGAGPGAVRGGGGMAYSKWDEPDQPMRTNAREDNWPGNTGQRQGGWTQQRSTASSGRATIWDDGGVTSRKGAPSDSSYNGGSTVRQRRAFDEPRRETRREVQPIVANQTVVEGITFIPARESAEWPKVVNIKRPWDHILLEDGTQIRPSYQSDWKVTFDKETPFTPWYNPNTHILFHIRSPQGVVSQEPIAREETMSYLDHELDPTLRRVAEEAERKRGGRVAAAWQMVENLRPNPSSPLATMAPLSEDAEGHNVKLMNPDDYLVTSSLTDAIKRACLKLKVDRPEVLKQAFELYVDRGVLTTIVDPDFELLFQLTLAPGYKQLFQLMMDSDADEELLDEVDARVTAGINRALQQNMGLVDWSIDSFREDIGDLLSALRQNNQVGEQVTQIFEEYAVEVISRALAHYNEKELDESIRKAVGLDEDVVALVWRERSTVTRLPITSDELKVPCDTGTVVSESGNPEIHHTLCAIFDRTTDMPHTFFGRYLATSDGTVYSVVKGYLNDQAILVFKADFTLQ